MPKTAVPRQPESLERKANETRLKSRNRSLASLLGIGDSERQLGRDLGSGLNDVIGRGTLASLIGLPGDLGGMAENGIRGLMGLPEVVPYGGSEHIGRKLEEYGLVSPERRPVTEAVASMISPAQLASASYRAPQMARAGTTALERLMTRSTMGGVNRPAAQTGAITSDTLPILKAMTRDEFLGSPKIVSASDAKNLRPIELTTLRDQPSEPFMGGRYQAKFNEDGSVVFDGDKPIASYNFGDTLVVDKNYRKQGIGNELVYQQRTYFPAPAVARTRNKVSQGIQEDVWDRIQSDILNYERSGQPVR